MDVPNPRPVKTKKDFYRRWVDGEFGNRIRAWNTFEELKSDNYAGRVNIRYTKPDSQKILYNIYQEDIAEEIKKLGSIDDFRFNEPAPDDELVLQGELYDGQHGFWLRYSKEQTNMRKAMENSLHANGLTAKTILRHVCFPSSYEDLMDLLGLYPEHVVEFGVYAELVGDGQHRNTIIWEVRAY